jgi:GTP pyrophosphokinase
MRTLGVMRPDKQARIARVTRDVLIPLAERLGVQALKSELETWSSPSCTPRSTPGPAR